MKFLFVFLAIIVPLLSLGCSSQSAPSLISNDSGDVSTNSVLDSTSDYTPPSTNKPNGEISTGIFEQADRLANFAFSQVLDDATCF